MPAGKIFEEENEYWEQQAVIGPADKSRKEKFGTLGYLPEYAQMCYKLLSESDTAKTKSHCCRHLQCSKPTLLRWMQKFPEFKEAIEAGLAIGASNWRDRIASHAYEPSSTVNNGLIKMLSANVYGIKDEPTVVIQNTNIQGDPEEALKKRGIPIPTVGIEDVREDEEGTGFSGSDGEVDE